MSWGVNEVVSLGVAPGGLWSDWLRLVPHPLEVGGMWDEFVSGELMS